MAMDAEAFRIWGKKMVDFVADYWLNLRSRQPLHNVKPGYLRAIMPDEAPEEPESWDSIFSDVENCIMQGVKNGSKNLSCLLFFGGF